MASEIIIYHLHGCAVKDVSEASDTDKLTLGVFMDLSKAFDAIDHNFFIE